MRGAQVQLSAGRAKAAIDPTRGGAVLSLTLEADAAGAGAADPIEVLWQPDSWPPSGEFPGGGMPFLFPFAGRVFHGGQSGAYEWRGKVRALPIHGFAPRRAWTLEQHDCATSRAVLTLASDAESYAAFPFPFQLTMTVDLKPTAMTIRVEVLNTGLAGSEPMPLAPGFHPYFRVPMPSAHAWDSARVTFDADETIPVTSEGDAGEGVAGQIRGFPLSDPRASNLILGGVMSAKASLAGLAHGQAVVLEWSPAGLFKNIVLYGKRDLGFVCIEPWAARPNPLARQEAIWLPPAERISFEMSIRTADPASL